MFFLFLFFTPCNAMLHMVGNYNCFPRHNLHEFSFEKCCLLGPESNARGCWFPDFHLTYDNCCYTSVGFWQTLPDEVSFAINFDLLHHMLALNEIERHDYLSLDEGFWRNDSLQQQAIRLTKDPYAYDPHICRTHFNGYFVKTTTMAGVNPDKEEGRWHDVFCVPRGLAPETFLSAVVPMLYRHQEFALSWIHMNLDPVDFPDPTNMTRLGNSGKGYPPPTIEQLEFYRDLYHICAECELKRFGNRDGDGGYLMCDTIQNFKGRIKAVYSFGIEKDDSWGRDVAIKYNVPELHRYDCFSASMMNETDTGNEGTKIMFHYECLGIVLSASKGQGSIEARVARSLEYFLQQNGHDQVGNSELIGKIDVEGAEWITLASARIEDLKKFAQIVIEFHSPAITNILDAFRLHIRARAIDNLYQAGFLMVHVHGNFNCGTDPCLEVTFARVDDLDVKWRPACILPTNHPLDVKLHKDLPELDVSQHFQLPLVSLVSTPYLELFRDNGLL